MLSQSNALFIRSVCGATLRAKVGQKNEQLSFIDRAGPALGSFPCTRLRRGRKPKAWSLYALHNAICLPPALQAKVESSRRKVGMTRVGVDVPFVCPNLRAYQLF